MFGRLFARGGHFYELLEAITDRCLDVANLAEGISLENS